MSSKYCYPKTNVLINKFNIKDQDKLQMLERKLTYLRLFELGIKPILGRFDLMHLQDIHYYIFQDIYSWAGTIRTVDLAKGNTLFAKALFITDESRRIFGELKKENYLKDYDINKFSERAAYYLAEINVLHPFREGNGRTQREFIRILSLNAGFNLDWSKIPAKDIFEAQVASVYDIKKLVEVIRNSITR
ncbi:hypothetical protein BHF71_05760 [Vulcanibacillus modesticaldus]|uniref:protein adenylyltransferase n=1 Tax=Vulcanibacillus modesticaldus TaxID=337097 RepID=A0A1D2YX43_9BACI|nr:Fic family protein [Vulcanibacillus modesticaldus]OEG00193.1 hypothetical protein BHF71_05760 [Vulcanibacillus modesticaldus]